MARVLLVVATFSVLYGCGQASSPVEREEKQGGIEKTSPEKEPRSSAKERNAESTNSGRQPTPEPGSKEEKEAWAAQDRAKEAAARHEMTLQDFRKMGQNEIIKLGNCQTNKVVQMYGQKKADKYFDKYVDMVANAKGDFPSVQEYMLRDGISCTWQEMNSYAASASASG